MLGGNECPVGIRERINEDEVHGRLRKRLVGDLCWHFGWVVGGFRGRGGLERLRDIYETEDELCCATGGFSPGLITTASESSCYFTLATSGLGLWLAQASACCQFIPNQPLNLPPLFPSCFS